jgi:hypothetical protein
MGFGMEGPLSSGFGVRLEGSDSWQAGGLAAAQGPDDAGNRAIQLIRGGPGFYSVLFGNVSCKV